MLLNHHSATLLPYYLDDKDEMYFILEKKDQNYKSPFFDNGLNFLGGNWEKGKNPDLSPEDTLRREIEEEFWWRYDKPESLNKLMGEEFINRNPEALKYYDESTLQKIKNLGSILLEKIEYVGDFKITVKPPITKTDLVFGSTIFTRELLKSETEEFRKLIKDLSRKLTPDNLRWESEIVCSSLTQINVENSKFAWGYDHITNMLLESCKLPSQRLNVIRTLSLVQVEYLPYSRDLKKSSKDVPTFIDFENLGIEYILK